MIFSMAKDDIEKGKGLCVIDPHGDLAESVIIPYSQKSRKTILYILIPMI